LDRFCSDVALYCSYAAIIRIVFNTFLFVRYSYSLLWPQISNKYFLSYLFTIRKPYAFYRMVMLAMTLGYPWSPKPPKFLHFALPFVYTCSNTTNNNKW